MCLIFSMTEEAPAGWEAFTARSAGGIRFRGLKRLRRCSLEIGACGIWRGDSSETCPVCVRALSPLGLTNFNVRLVILS